MSRFSIGALGGDCSKWLDHLTFRLIADVLVVASFIFMAISFVLCIYSLAHQSFRVIP